MLKAAIARTPILVLILMFMAVGYTIAHNKVVVVPLGADAGISGYEIVQRSESPNPFSNSFIGYTVFCPSGKKPIGGGIQLSSISHIMSGSYPGAFSSQLGWTVRVSLKGGATSGSSPATVYAICANTIN